MFGLHHSAEDPVAKAIATILNPEYGGYEYLRESKACPADGCIAGEPYHSFVVQDFVSLLSLLGYKTTAKDWLYLLNRASQDMTPDTFKLVFDKMYQVSPLPASAFITSKGQYLKSRKAFATCLEDAVDLCSVITAFKQVVVPYHAWNDQVLSGPSSIPLLVNLNTLVADYVYELYCAADRIAEDDTCSRCWLHDEPHPKSRETMDDSVSIAKLAQLAKSIRQLEVETSPNNMIAIRRVVQISKKLITAKKETTEYCNLFATITASVYEACQPISIAQWTSIIFSKHKTPRGPRYDTFESLKSQTVIDIIKKVDGWKSCRHAALTDYARKILFHKSHTWNANDHVEPGIKIILPDPTWTIGIADGPSWKVHEMILAEWSFFARCVSSGMAECKTKTIMLPHEMPVDSLRLIVALMYGSNVISAYETSGLICDMNVADMRFLLDNASSYGLFPIEEENEATSSAVATVSNSPRLEKTFEAACRYLQSQCLARDKLAFVSKVPPDYRFSTFVESSKGMGDFMQETCKRVGPMLVANLATSKDRNVLYSFLGNLGTMLSRFVPYVGDGDNNNDDVADVPVNHVRAAPRNPPPEGFDFFGLDELG